MPKNKVIMSWEESVDYTQEILKEKIRSTFRPLVQMGNELICMTRGHWEHRMNPVIKRGATDASGGSDIVRYTPVYCVRCGTQWKEPN